MLKGKERCKKLERLNKELGEKRKEIKKVVYHLFDYWIKHTNNAKNINLEFNNFIINLHDNDIYLPENYISMKRGSEILEIEEVNKQVLKTIYNNIDRIENDIINQLEKQIKSIR